MAQNYAEKFSSKVQESFKKGAFTNNAVNHDYDFVGVKTVKIYSVNTAAMHNYNKSHGGGFKRYGDAEEIGTTVQELQLKIDRSFTFTIDKRDNMDSMDVLNPGKALQRQIEDRVIPEVDKYRLAAIVNGVDKSKKTDKTQITSANAYTKFLDAKINLMNDNVPMNGCVAYISTNFYKQIRLDSNFIKASDIAQNMLIKGQVGEIDGIPLILVPDSYFPAHSGSSTVSGGSVATWSNLDQIDTVLGGANAKVEFILTNSAAVVGCEKLTDYKVHDNPPGINGYLVEGRICYDAFILDKKKPMIFVQIKPN